MFRGSLTSAAQTPNELTKKNEYIETNNTIFDFGAQQTKRMYLAASPTLTKVHVPNCSKRQNFANVSGDTEAGLTMGPPSSREQRGKARGPSRGDNRRKIRLGIFRMPDSWDRLACLAQLSLSTSQLTVEFKRVRVHVSSGVFVGVEPLTLIMVLAPEKSLASELYRSKIHWFPLYTRTEILFSALV